MTIDAETFGSKEYDRAVLVGNTSLDFYCPNQKITDDFMNRIRVCASRRGHSVAFNPQKDPRIVHMKIFLNNT